MIIYIYIHVEIIDREEKVQMIILWNGIFEDLDNACSIWTEYIVYY